MIKPRSPRSSAPAQLVRAGGPGERAPHWPASFAAMGLSALLVATPLLPTESARTGSGLILIAGWLAILLAWLVGGWFRAEQDWRWGRTESACLLFLVLHSTSALLVGDQGNQRHAINMLWHWVSFGVAFFLARQLIRTPRQQRALVSVLIAVAVGVSVFGLYQYFAVMPALRAQFRADPERVLREAGIDAPPGSPERRQFADRLESREPTASFALTNSLAGFLVPWLMLLVAVGIEAAQRRPKAGLETGLKAGLETGLETGLDAGPKAPLETGLKAGGKRRGLMAVGLGLATIGVCLVFTKSRTAFAAAAIGVTLLLVWRSLGRRWNWRLPTIGVGVVVLLLLIGIQSRGLDRRVLTETTKALGYRIEYWQATWSMIREQPWLGCGPGNFQQCYALQKLPQASELVADPHNMFLELWSTAGTPALAAFVWMGVCFVWELRDARRGMPTGVKATATSPRTEILPIYAGGLLGVGVAAAEGLSASFLPDLELIVWGVPFAGLTIALLHPWVVRGSLPAASIVIGLIASSVNLLAAGGSAYPGVALSWWILGALALNAAGEHRVPGVWQRFRLAIVCGVGLSICAAFYQTMYLPVLEQRRYTLVAFNFQEQGHYQAAVAAYEAAAAADPRDPEPWTQLAVLHQQAALMQGARQLVQRFEEAAEYALRRDPHSHALHRRVGNLYFQLHAKTGQRPILDSAIRHYRRATELYPNSNILHAQLAWALAVARDESGARTEAELALQLDEWNPHREQKLSVQRLYRPHQPGETAEKAEPAMRQLRRAGNPEAPAEPDRQGQIPIEVQLARPMS